MTPQAGFEQRAYSVAAMRLMARRRLPRMVFDFADGGAEEEWTLRRNEAAFDDYALVPQPLFGCRGSALSVELFGEKLNLPVIIGPTGLAGAMWPRGELEAARAAAAAGTIYVMSHASTVTIEEMAREVSRPRWMQVFMYRDRGLTREFVERAQAAGFTGIVLTTDNQVLGQRERDLRNGFTIPPRWKAASAVNLASRGGWLWRMRQSRNMTFANYVKPGARGQDILSLGAYMAEMLDPAANWQDVAWLRGLVSGPLLLKGILHPDEARRAVTEGVDGIIVSNHGGRQLDGAIASLDALPGVMAAVEGRIPVLLDGGIRRGADVVKAMILGAHACLIGRPHLWGLALAGQRGVVHVLDIYRREIERVLTLCGADDVQQLRERPGLLVRCSGQAPTEALPHGSR